VKTVLHVAADRAYRLVDDQLWQALRENLDRPSLIGAHYAGRILRIEAGLDGAMIDLGLEQPGFLPLRQRSAKSGRLHEGQGILVEILRDGFAGKGPRLTLRQETFDGAEPPRQVRPPTPLWERMIGGLNPATIAAAYFDQRREGEAMAVWARLHAPEILPRLSHLPAREWEESEWREQIGVALSPGYPLRNGGALFFESTRVGLIVDVDSGAATPLPSLEQTARETNGLAAEAIAQQVSLRNHGGIIIVDFIDMQKPSFRAQTVEILRAAAQADPQLEWIGNISRLGLLEMRRRRRGPVLADMFGSGA
jgi:ribonuclease G